MALIDIGSAAIDRAEAEAIAAYTYIFCDNPANLSGKITKIEIWANVNLVGVEVATFFLVSGTNFSTRATASLGNIAAGSKQSFTVDLAVAAGDYIGLYQTSGSLEMTSTGGAGYWYVAGNKIPCTNVLFAQWSAQIFSLYGTGATVGGPKSNPSLILIGHGGI